MEGYFENFMSMYKFPMHKITLDKVKLVKAEKNAQGKQYYHFIGKFRFTPNIKLLSDKGIMDKRDHILKALKTLENTSIEYRKKYTKKINSNGETSKWAFNYIFNLSPSNLVDFNVDYESGKMDIDVTGYGTFL